MRKYPRYFEDLKVILGTDLCTRCGACKGVCDILHPDIEIIDFSNGEPKLKDRDLCTGCGTCIDICPQTKYDYNLTNIYKESVKSDLGYLNGGPLAIEGSELRFPVQDGGIVSAMVMNAIKSNYVDAAVLTRRDEKWIPITEIVTDPNEIYKYAGSKYTTSKPIPKLLEALANYTKVLFVGLPHQVKAARKIQLYKKLDLGGKNLKAIIGLFCMHSFEYEKLFRILRINPEEIDKMEMHHGIMASITKNKTILQRSIEELNSAVNSYCHACNDFTSELADISVGTVGAFKDRNTVLIRNQIGKELFEISRVIKE